MPLRFYPLNSVESIMSQFQTNKQSLITSLIDLKPQQLIFSQRCFLSMNDNQIPIENSFKSLTEEEQVVYSNIHSLLWVSEPVKLQSNNFILENECDNIIDPNQNLENNQKFRIDEPQSTKNKLSVRYLYLPPLGEYLKRFLSKIKNSNNSSQSTNYLHSNQLENQLQQKLQARHKSMFVFARSISSSIVYEFGSKYVRYDHFTLNAKKQKSIEDIMSKLKETNFQQEQNWIESFIQGITLKLTSIGSQSKNFHISHGFSKINSFVVIKNNSYSSQREYEVYRVKLTCSRQDKTNTQLNNYNQVSMEIGSQKLMTIKSYQQRIQCQKYQQDPEQINELSLKLLNVTLTQVSLLTSSQSKTIAFENTKIIHGPENQIFTQQKYIKVLNFQYLYSILVNKMERGIIKSRLNENKKIDSIELNYQKLSQIFLYYLYSANTLRTIRQLKFQDVFLQMSNSQHSPRNEIGQSQKDQLNQISIMLPEEKLASSITVDKATIQDTSLRQFKENLQNLWERIFILDQVQSSLNQQNAQKPTESSYNSNLTRFDQLKIFQESIVKSSSLKFPTLRQSNENSIIGLLTKYQSINNFNPKKANTQMIVLQGINGKLQLYKQKNILKLMENEVKAKNHQRQINYQEVYQLLTSKLKQHRIQLNQQLPLLSSYPMQIKHLNEIIKVRQSKISELQSKVAQLQKDIFERQIKKNIQQQKIHKYQQDQIFYHKILQELNAKQEKLTFQIQDKKKTLIELQCTRIKNMHLNQTIEQQKITQARLLQQKSHFLEAISHLSKENIYYINSSEQLKSTVSQLQLKLSKFQTIDLDLSQRIEENQLLKEQLQNIHKWKQDIEAEHDRLIDKQVAKFNHVLKINFDKYKQLKLKNEQFQEQIKSLNQRNISLKNDNLMLETQLIQIKARYFNFSHLEMQIPLKIPNQPYLNLLYGQNNV